MSSRALVVYARPPLAGGVKRRLQPAFSAEESLALYGAMLADTLERMARASAGLATLFVSWSEPFQPAGELAGLIPAGRAEVQVGDDLGERMAATLQEKLRAGFKQVTLVGADAPSLPAAYVRRGFEALDGRDVVLGPSTDGGYYLLGCRRLHLRILQDMPWGSAQVLSITRQRLRDGKIPHLQLPPWSDVDTPADVTRLWSELQRMKAKGAAELPARTFGALAALMPGRAPAPPPA